jgi:predicted transcriptional regulator
MSRDEILDALDSRGATRVLEEVVDATQVLASAGLLSVMHEALKAFVLDAPKRFYGFHHEEWTREGGRSSYDKECRFLVDRDVFASHVQWLVERSALTGEQASALEDLKIHRDDVVHRIFDHLMLPARKPDVDIINNAYGAFRALDDFWRQVAIDEGWVDSDEGEALTIEEVQSGAGDAIRVAMRSYRLTFNDGGFLRQWLDTEPDVNGFFAKWFEARK